MYPYSCNSTENRRSAASICDLDHSARQPQLNISACPQPPERSPWAKSCGWWTRRRRRRSRRPFGGGCYISPEFSLLVCVLACALGLPWHSLRQKLYHRRHELRRRSLEDRSNCGLRGVQANGNPLRIEASFHSSFGYGHLSRQHLGVQVRPVLPQAPQIP